MKMMNVEGFGLLAVSLPLIISLASCQTTLQKDKVCWSECKDGSNEIISAVVEGCRRRRANPGFWCDGLTGPPCTMKRGDRVYLKLEFNTDRVPMNVTQERNHITRFLTNKYKDSKIWKYPKANSNATQDVFWVTGMGLEIPWVGMDKNACKYMEPPCGEAVGSNAVRRYRFPIDCLQVYPAGYFKLRWAFSDKISDTESVPMACFRTNIKIV